MTQATLDTSEWLHATLAARALGVGIPALRKVAPEMSIRVRIVPGRRGPRYNREDVQAAVARLEGARGRCVSRGEASTA